MCSIYASMLFLFSLTFPSLIDVVEAFSANIGPLFFLPYFLLYHFCWKQKKNSLRSRKLLQFFLFFSVSLVNKGKLFEVLWRHLEWLYPIRPAPVPSLLTSYNRLSCRVRFV